MTQTDSQPIQRFDQNHRRSRVVAYGDALYFAGQCGDDLSANAAQQTREALARIDKLLDVHGSDKSRLLSVQLWITDLADFETINEIYDAWVVPDHRPARYCAVVGLVMPGAKVEVIPVAAR